MREKKERAYFMSLLSGILLIYVSFQSAFADVTVSLKQNMEVFVLSFDNYVYLIVGLLLISFTIYMYMHLGTYKCGRLFVGYLTAITVSICMAAATKQQYKVGNILIGIFAFISNVFLFWAIGYITLLTHSVFFKRALVFLGGFTFLLSIVYVISMTADNMVFFILKDKIVMVDYLLTVIVTIISMWKGYRGATIYAQRQIRFLSLGLLLGIVIFFIMRWMPMLAMIKIPESQGEVVVSYQANLTCGIQEIYPVMIFTGMAIVMIYILIKREYLTMDENGEMWRYLLSTIYLILGNTYLFFVASVEFSSFVVFNVILMVPLILFSYHMRKRKENTYDTHLIEVLEEERQRISVLLHDEVLQDLIALSHFTKNEEEKERLATVIGEIRNISQDLYPTIVEDLGLEQALNIFVEEVNADYNIDLDYRYDYPQGILPKGISLVMYRSIKELVTNAIKHSHCKNITIAIRDIAGDMECAVTDDGCGFQMPENIELLKSPHMGLYTVRRQIAELNGNMRIQSDASGSKFEILFPLKGK